MILMNSIFLDDDDDDVEVKKPVAPPSKPVVNAKDSSKSLEAVAEDVVAAAEAATK